MTALRGLLRKEVLHIIRDRRTLAVLLALPVVQVILFGSAIRTDIRRIRLAVVDPAPDTATLALRDRFAAAGIFRIVAVTRRSEDVESLLQSGAAQQALVFSQGFAEDLHAGRPARVQILTDASEPNTGRVLQAYAQTIVQEYERQVRRVAPAVVIVPQSRMRFNPTRESANLFIPGLMAFVLTIISSLMTAISIAREKETGTLEALLVSPLRPAGIIVGKVAPYLVIGLISLVAILVEARLIFGVPLRGSVTLLVVAGTIFILVSLALGVLVSARTDSQRVAMLGTMLATMLPNLLLSGFIFPIESMPVALRAVTYIVPARWFVVIARGIMLKGVGLSLLWPEMLILSAMAVLLLLAASRAFKDRLA